MSTLRTHVTFRVDTWTPDGESFVEHIAGVEDYQVALATYRAACERWPSTLACAWCRRVRLRGASSGQKKASAKRGSLKCEITHTSLPISLSKIHLSGIRPRR